MDVIYKYVLPLRAPVRQHDFDWPVGAKVLHVGAQQEETVTLWVQEKAEHPGHEGPKERRSFIVYGTGFPVDPEEVKEHVGSVLHEGFVWHVFEIK